MSHLLRTLSLIFDLPGKQPLAWKVPLQWHRPSGKTASGPEGFVDGGVGYIVNALLWVNYFQYMKNFVYLKKYELSYEKSPDDAGRERGAALLRGRTDPCQYLAGSGLPARHHRPVYERLVVER